MTITYQGTSVNSGATSAAVDAPGSIAAWDVMVCFKCDRATSGTTSAPTGWTRVASAAAASKYRLEVFYAVYGVDVGFGDPGAGPWTFTGTTRTLARIVSYRGVDHDTPMDVTPSCRVNASGTYGAVSIAPVTVNNWVLAAFAFTANNYTWSSPTASGVTLAERIESAYSTYMDIAVADGAQTTAQATGNSSATPSTGAVNGGALVALRPAPTTKTLSLDAVLQQAFAKTASIDAYLQALKTRSPALDALINAAGLTRTAALDAFTQKSGLTSTANLDAYLQALRTLTTPMDAYVQALRTLAPQLDALLTATGLTSPQLDAYVQALRTLTPQLDALLTATGLTSTVQLDAYVQAFSTLAPQLDAVLTQTFGTWIGLDAILSRSVLVEKIISLDAIVWSALADAFSKVRFIAVVSKSRLTSTGRHTAFIAQATRPAFVAA